MSKFLHADDTDDARAMTIAQPSSFENSRANKNSAENPILLLENTRLILIFAVTTCPMTE